MIKIKVVDPKKPDQPQFLDLKPETKPNQECFIGRFLNCDLFLDSSEVSRMHGKVFKKMETIILLTWVAGVVHGLMAKIP